MIIVRRALLRLVSEDHTFIYIFDVLSWRPVTVRRVFDMWFQSIVMLRPVIDI